MPLILDWIQLFNGAENDQQWSAFFVSFVDANVDRPERLNALCSRLTTGFWCGSFSSKLEAERDMLLRLGKASSNFNVHQWIDRTVSQMKLQIVDERSREANRKASYTA